MNEELRPGNIGVGDASIEEAQDLIRICQDNKETLVKAFKSKPQAIKFWMIMEEVSIREAQDKVNEFWKERYYEEEL